MDGFDHDLYKVLGLNRNASKQEIKDAFRKLAMKFHPDKHSQSTKVVRESAAIRFKQVSEAYEVLIDDSNRAHYNLRSRSATGHSSHRHQHYSSSYYANSNANSYGPRSRHGFGSASASSVDGLIAKFQNLLCYLTTRTFFLHAAFASGILGSIFVINMSEEAIWKMHNSGKSFEEAMESIEKARAHKDEK